MEKMNRRIQNAREGDDLLSSRVTLTQEKNECQLAMIKSLKNISRLLQSQKRELFCKAFQGERKPEIHPA